MYLIESKKFGDFTVEIYPDNTAEDPRTWGWEDLPASILKTWQNGEVVGFVTKSEGVEIDSCWGFYSVESAYEHAKENFPTRDDQYYFDKWENG